MNIMKKQLPIYFKNLSLVLIINLIKPSICSNINNLYHLNFQKILKYERFW